jgi:hypothetical protein
MVTSIFLAKLFGLFFVILGLSAMLHPKRLQNIFIELKKSPVLMFMTSFVLLIMGIALVISHSIFVLDWRLLITVLCWIVFLKSAACLILPEKWIENPHRLLEHPGFYYSVSIIYLLLGAFMIYHGFFCQA